MVLVCEALDVREELRPWLGADEVVVVVVHEGLARVPWEAAHELVVGSVDYQFVDAGRLVYVDLGGIAPVDAAIKKISIIRLIRALPGLGCFVGYVGLAGQVGREEITASNHCPAYPTYPTYPTCANPYKGAYLFSR